MRAYWKIVPKGENGPALICETLAEARDGGYTNRDEFDVSVVRMPEKEYADAGEFDGF